MIRSRRLAALVALTAAASCTRGAPPPASRPAPVAAARPVAAPGPAPAETTPPRRPDPVAPPEVAYRLGLMPLASTGVPDFLRAHPTVDGRGVLIAILDSGVDPGVLGLQATTTGAPKLLDLRDVSGEGDVELEPVAAGPDGLVRLPGGIVLGGASAVRAVATGTEWFGGVLRELPFGGLPSADFNGNGSNRDRYGVVVVRGESGWLAFVDTNGDGTLADETAVADFARRRQTFTFSSRFAPRGQGPITAALNLGDDPARPGRPHLAFYLDTSSHGTHVAGIAAGHDLYGVSGFDGVAPGAQLLGLKISDNSRGGISTTGSMLRAMEYAARFAEERGLALVMNMSFGIGNEVAGGAAMDSLVDAFLLRHPDVVFTMSAGNDGPGTSTTGLPASAELALAVGAVYPGAFGRVQFGVEGRDILGWWGSRGGDLAKPDFVAPGMAYSSVPAWQAGQEIMLGTSMAAPYGAGLAALLASAAVQERRPVVAAQIIQALRVSARRFEGETQADEGYGMPQIAAAYRWLLEGRDVPRVRVQALGPPSDAPRGVRLGADVGPAGRGPVRTAAYRRAGLASEGDTIQRFRVTAVPPGAGGAADGAGATFRLVADAPWVRPAAPTVTLDATGAGLVTVHYDGAEFVRPGRYVGTVYGYSAADTAAGPLFALVNTVIVSDSSPTIAATGRKVPGGGAARYYLRVPEQASGVSVRASVRDTTTAAMVYLFEPSGRPSRAVERLDLGGKGPSRVAEVVRANDVVPGVWEVVVQSLPGREVRYDLQAIVPSLRLVAVDSGRVPARVTFGSALAVDTAILVTAEQLGITRLRQVAIVGGVAVRDTLEAPPWATGLQVETWLPREAWDQLTDFSVMVYDGEGEQLGQGAMNYAVHRFEAELPEQREARFPVQVELFPAFAHAVPPPRIDVMLRVTFVGAPRALTVSAGADVSVGSDTVAVLVRGHGTAAVTVSGLSGLPPAPGWDEWVRVRAVGRAEDWVAVERVFAIHRAP